MSFYRPLRHEGYLAEYADGKTIEHKTITCSHCSKVMIIKFMQLPENIEYGGYCRGCDRHICADCYAKPTCKPIEKWCEEIEKRDILRRNYEMAMSW